MPIQMLTPMTVIRAQVGSSQKGFGEDGAQYYLASVIGILVFIVVAVISLIVYNLLPSVKNEEDFQ